MRRVSSVLVAAGAAALATYFLDAQQGRRRRAVLRDKVYGRLSHLGEASRVVAVDVRNRAIGTLGTVRQRVIAHDVPDEILAERVRAALGRVVSHPGSIEVQASQGTVTLRGQILEREAGRALRAVRAVPGVHGVRDELEHHEQAGDVPGLQGGRTRLRRPDIAQQHWAPATRLMVGAAGTALALYGLGRRSLSAPLFLIGGAAMLARASTNMETRRLLGWGGRRSIDFIKTLHIEAPLEEVFEFWSNFENFPKFMRNVREVRKNRDDSWHWEVAGPLGARVQWDSTVTQLVPNELISWATVPGAQVQHAGRVRFQPEGDGTRLQIEMGYNPAGGALGHAVASLFGADPLTEMDQDLMRLKAYFETGTPARDAAKATTAPRA
jgi:uncharacterized membrane protein